MSNGFLDLLRQGVVLFDGAIGTELYAHGVFINRCFDEINLSNPSLVESIHGEYVQAGADVIETNTFGANRAKLKLHGLDSKLEEINVQGARLARKASSRKALVAGSMGPLGIKIEPWGPTSNEEAVEFFAEQARALLEGGVDLFILETFSDLNEIHQAVRGIKKISDLPVIAQMTLQKDGLGLFGTEPGEFALRLTEWGADVVGVNCSVGPRITLEAIEKMASTVETYLSAQPNAGIPQNVDGRNIYMVSPEYMAEYSMRFVKAGASVVGGCCGTTPEHIRAMRNALSSVKPAKHHVSVVISEEIPEWEARSIAAEEKSLLASKLVKGEFVRLVEMVPPRGCDPSEIIASAKDLQDHGIDAINIPDSPRASSRMSPIAMAVLIEQRTGMETVLHYCCRDRNILGMQSDILGAHALGLRNMLIITGDPVKAGDYPDATSVFDIDSIGLTNVIYGLNRGRDIGGHDFGVPTSFLIGVGVNPGAADFELEIDRLHWKVDAGAEFAITQPVFDLEVFERFRSRIKSIKIPVIAGIWPLTSYKNAEFMNNELPGVSVPKNIMLRMKNTLTGESAAKEGVAIANELLTQLYPSIAGVQVSAPFNRHSLALEVVRGMDKDL
ncbi:MAG: bifunctional homocysteine S-methyltransferase/methylenetetrahydrofolate reductase [Candidatus Krumholzibacteriota bacterium]|nr:bifunctional homocysteine S-methyltransferase/methylenetetrahydrofolate reductase [Candidatus Krumholzibacteriota bacterium]